MRKERKSNDRRNGQRRKTYLVPNWKTAHRWLSVQISALIAGAASVYELVPTAKEYLSADMFHYLMIVALVGAILARLYQQNPKGNNS